MEQFLLANIGNLGSLLHNQFWLLRNNIKGKDPYSFAGAVCKQMKIIVP